MNNKRSSIFCFLLLLLLFLSCNKSRKLNYALEFADTNRTQLEKVLEYYKDDPLKLKAARFLVENIAGHYELRKDSMGGATKIYDAKVITAEYLIKNIDQSFTIWKKYPWGKYISFDDFCELILPYRIADEPLEDWREVYYDRFHVILDTMSNATDVVYACRLINDQLSLKWMHDSNAGDNNTPLKLLEKRRGDCAKCTNLMVYAARSLGIPVGIDGVLSNPNLNHRHQWNYLLDTTGSIVVFVEGIPTPDRKTPPRNGYLKHGLDKAMGKVYRYTFQEQDKIISSLRDEKAVPECFQNKYIKDVSSDYFEKRVVEIECIKRKNEDEIMYLAVFSDCTWKPITFAPIKKNKAVFEYIEPQIVFLPVCLRKGNVYPAGLPFYLSEDKDITLKLEPDTLSRQQLRLTRKFFVSKSMIKYMNRMVGGQFQGADNKQFRNPTTFYKIEKMDGLNYHEFEVTDKKKYSYVRYLAPNRESSANIAELEFYNTSDSTKLLGKIIGTEGTFEIKDKEVVFDENPLSFFDSKANSIGWVGLQLEKPEQIKKIRYLSRNDDNCIRPGDQYELFYFSSEGWRSLGKQQGDIRQVLIYENAPSNALFWLHNITRGNEERIFTYEDNKQVWW